MFLIFKYKFKLIATKESRKPFQNRAYVAQLRIPNPMDQLLSVRLGG